MKTKKSFKPMEHLDEVDQSHVHSLYARLRSASTKEDILIVQQEFRKLAEKAMRNQKSNNKTYD